MEDAAIKVITGAQRKAYPDEYLTLQRQRELPKKSKLLGLQPWLDDEGQMRCDGSLKYAEYLPQDARFPIILPRKDCVTKLIVKHYHEKNNHASGTNQLLAALSTRFWIISGREEIREWEKECNECQRRKAKAAKQIMVPLPQIRLRFPCDHSHRLPWIMVNHSSLCGEEGHVDRNVTCVCLPALQQEQSIWKWPMHVTRIRS